MPNLLTAKLEYLQPFIAEVDVHAVTARMREIAAEEDATLRSSSSSSLLIQLGERKRKSLPAL